MKSVVLITGATGGLGKAFAAECAARGWDLFLTDLDNGGLNTLAEGLRRQYGVEARYYACDLVEQAARDALWSEINRLGLVFFFLFNVAGIGCEGPFKRQSSKELHALLRLNIEAVVDTTQRVLQFRDSSRRLHIVNVSSLAGFYPMPTKAVYAASKRFLIDFSLALREELSSDGVSVTVLCPAGLPTHQASIRRITSQGLAGRLTTVNVGKVAARTIDLALAGKALYIPGFINRILRFLSGFIPAPLLAALIGRRWRAIGEKT